MTEQQKVTPAIFDKKAEAKAEEKKKDVPMIAYRKIWTDSDGVLHDEMSEPIPVSEWAEYEKEHKL